MSSTPDILKKIVQRKREEIAERLLVKPLKVIIENSRHANKPRGFVKAIETKIAQNLPGIIAEIKKASPSKGVMRPDFHPAEIARSYGADVYEASEILPHLEKFKGKGENN